MERPEVFVPDASVVVKWFVREEHSDKSRMMKDEFVEGKIRLVAPALTPYEVVNALRFHPIVKLPPRSMVTCMRALQDLGITIEPSLEVWEKAIDISTSEGISVYDSIYLALALALDAKMVTADRKLRKRVGKGLRGNIVYIKNLTL